MENVDESPVPVYCDIRYGWVRTEYVSTNPMVNCGPSEWAHDVIEWAPQEYVVEVYALSEPEAVCYTF